MYKEHSLYVIRNTGSRSSTDSLIALVPGNSVTNWINNCLSHRDACNKTARTLDCNFLNDVQSRAPSLRMYLRLTLWRIGASAFPPDELQYTAEITDVKQRIECIRQNSHECSCDHDSNLVLFAATAAAH